MKNLEISGLLALILAQKQDTGLPYKAGTRRTGRNLGSGDEDLWSCHIQALQGPVSFVNM